MGESGETRMSNKNCGKVENVAMSINRYIQTHLYNWLRKVCQQV